jgi:hypothetical protein
MMHVNSKGGEQMERREAECLVNSILSIVPEFTPSIWFEPEMDALMLMTENTVYRSDRIDEFLTLFENPETHQIIGLKLKGFRWLYKYLVEIGDIEHDHFVMVVWLLDAAMRISVYEAQKAGATIAPRKARYVEANSLAGHRRVPKSEILKASVSEVAA